MEIVGDEVKRDVKKVLADFNVLLSAVTTKLSLHLCPTVKAIGLHPIFFVAHKPRSFQDGKGSRKGGIEQALSALGV